MDNDFGLLVDYLRNELDEPARAAVHKRLLAEGDLFEAFVRLRRTYALLRSMPQAHVGAPAAYLADLQREFSARGWVDLLPALTPTRALIAALRAEFSVRALLACVPQLVPNPLWVSRLRAALGARAVVARLPVIEARAQWARALRSEFVLRATVAALPELEVAPQFARRVRLALYEAAGAPDPAPVALPTLAPVDSFRRRLFRNILLAARSRLLPARLRIDLREYQFGRVMAGAMRRSRRPVVVTMALHALALALLFFVTGHVRSNAGSPMMVGYDRGAALAPLLPEGNRGPVLFPQGERGGHIERTDERPPFEDMIGHEFGAEVAPPPAAEDGPVLPQPAWESTLGASPLPRTEAGVWLRMRAENRREKIGYLGSEPLYEALELALVWLRDNQQPDGHWGLVEASPPVSRALRNIQQVELTAAALLALLGDGHTSRESLLGYDQSVRRGIAWLVNQQNPDGRIGPGGQPIVLAHAMATLALCEEYVLTRDRAVAGPLRAACRWLSQTYALDGASGFPYREGQPGSMITSVWGYMALVTAIKAGVPSTDASPERVDRLLGWILSETRGDAPLIDAAGEVLARSDLLPTSGGAALAAISADPEYVPRAGKWMTRLARELPTLELPAPESRATDAADMRYLFMASLAFANHDAGPGAERWKSAMAATLLARQSKEGRQGGSFPATSDYADLYGRVFNTAFAALTIENAWRVRVK